MLKKIAFVILSVLLGAVFILSAYTKLYPIEPFEYTFVDLGIANWKLAPFIARFFIGLEFFIGALFILNIRVKATCKIAGGALIFFSLYLLGLIFIVGNKGNCGCFGNYFFMTPLQALIKNAIMLLIIVVLYKKHDGFKFRGVNILFYILVIAAFVLPHMLNYVDFSYSQAYLFKHDKDFKLELDSLYNHAEVNTPPQSLRTGKHVIAFMSLTCPHCRVASKKMKIMKDRNPNISIYFVLNGDEEMLAPFFEDTKAKNIPFCILLGKSFVFLAGTEMPSIYLVNNGVVENRVDYFHLDQDEIEKWMNKK